MEPPQVPTRVSESPRLPLAKEGSQSQRQIAAEPKSALAPRTQRILVVDDNHDSATTLALLLNLMGHETRTANDGIEALAVAERFRPDVVLLDIGMPRLNGYETARAMRAAECGRGLLLVALSGWGQDTDRQTSSEAGFDLHLVKPVDVAEIQKLLARRRSSDIAGQRV